MKKTRIVQFNKLIITIFSCSLLSGCLLAAGAAGGYIASKHYDIKIKEKNKANNKQDTSKTTTT